MKLGCELTHEAKVDAKPYYSPFGCFLFEIGDRFAMRGALLAQWSYPVTFISATSMPHIPSGAIEVSHLNRPHLAGCASCDLYDLSTEITRMPALRYHR